MKAPRSDPEGRIRNCNAHGVVVSTGVPLAGRTTNERVARQPSGTLSLRTTIILQDSGMSKSPHKSCLTLVVLIERLAKLAAMGHVYVCMYVCMYVCTYVCTYAYCVYICIYTYKYV